MKPLSNSQHFHASEPLLNGAYRKLLDLVRRRTRMRQQRAEKPWKGGGAGGRKRRAGKAGGSA
jgi:hypothetical protein